MPSSYTNNSGIEKPATGEQSGTWGVTADTNYDIIDRAMNGILSLSLSGTSSTLTTSDGVLSNGQYKMLLLTGTPSGTHTITLSPNDAQKIYQVVNNTAQSVIFTQGSGGNVTITAGNATVIYANGGGSGAAVKNALDALAVTSAKLTTPTLTTPTITTPTITGGSISGLATDLAVADGGTGASTAAAALTNLGLTSTAAELNTLHSSGVTNSDLTNLHLTTTQGFSLIANSSYANMRITLGVVIGSDVQAYSAVLDTFAAIGVGPGMGSIPYYGVVNYTKLTIGAYGQVLGVNSGATAPQWQDRRVAQAVQLTTSGTSFSFTGIPTWVTQIVVTLRQTSVSGTNNMLVQVGDGAIVTTGYNTSTARISGTAVATSTGTSGLVIPTGSAADQASCSVTIDRSGDNQDIWVFTVSGQISGEPICGGGYINLSGALDRVRLIRNGSDTFDLGSVNLIYS